MYHVLTCLTTEHDWRLVVLAGTICWFASAVAISLFHRARASHGRTRATWIGLDAAVGGCGIWATHFVAMLAYDPGASAGYSIPVTLLSLVFAICIVAIGLCIALSSARQSVDCARRCVIGGGVAAMHYTGMAALELPALHCVVARHRFGLDCVWQPVRGNCTSCRRTSRQSSSYRGRHRPADGRHRFASFHGDGRRHAHSRSDARYRRVVDFSDRAFVPDVGRGLRHSRSIAAGGHDRSPREGRTP